MAYRDSGIVPAPMSDGKGSSASALHPEPGAERLLGCVAAAAQALLTSDSLDQAIMQAVDIVGRAVGVDRVCVFEMHPDAQTEERLFSRRYEWRRDPGFPAAPALRELSLKGSLPRWHAALSAGEAVQSLARDLTAAERAFLAPLGTKSVLAIPLMMAERWLGFVCFHDCGTEREWTTSDRDILRTVSACLGGAISRRQADHAAQASLRKYRGLFETSRDGIVIADMEGRIEDANPAYLGMLGYSLAELTGLSYQRLTPVAWAKRDGDVVVGQVLQRGYSDEYEKEYLRRDGTVHPVSVRVWLVRDEAGRPVRMWRIVRDIAERKRMEESLRASERQLRTIIDKLTVGVWLTDAEGRVVLSNPAAERIWGGVRFGAIEQYGQSRGWWHATGRRIEPHEWAPVRALTRGETYINEVVEVETLGGARKILAHSAIPIRDESNRIAGIVIVDDDITERKRAEIRLHESEERHRRITQALSDYVYTVWVQDGRAVSTEHGAACEAVTGYTRDDFANNPYLWLRMVVEADREAVIEQGRRILAGEPAGPLVHRIVRKDGQARWVRNTTVPHRDAQGRLLYYDGVIQDITEGRNAVESLRRSEQRFADISARAGEWIWEVDREGRYTYSSPAVEKVLGYKPEELLGRCFYEFFHPQERERLKAEAFAAFSRRDVFQSLLNRNVHKDGHEVLLETSAAPILDKDGALLGYRGSDRDITERQQAQDRIRQSQEMLQLVLDHIPQRVFWKDRESRYLGCNRAYLQDAGLRDVGQLMGKSDFDLPWKETAARYVADDKAVMESDAPKLDYEEPQPKPGGGSMWIKTSKMPMHDKEGKVVGILGVYEDITERKRAEESSRLARFAVDHCTIPVYWADREARVRYVNEAACRVSGYSREEMLALRLCDLDLALTPQAWPGFWAQLKERRALVRESRQRGKDGRVFPVESSASYLEYEGQEHCFVFAPDITERKRSEEAQGS